MCSINLPLAQNQVLFNIYIYPANIRTPELVFTG